MQEPSNRSWNENLPDFIKGIAIENAKPDIERKDKQWSWKVANMVPDPEDKEIGGSSQTVHVEVLAQTIGIKLSTRRQTIVVPESSPWIIVS